MKKFLSLFNLFFLNTAFNYSFAQAPVTTQRHGQIGIISYASEVLEKIESIHVDGYVRKLGSNQFIFPVGDANSARPFAAAADQTFGAYYNLNPDESNSSLSLAGGPFHSSQKELLIDQVSNVEYWDINGANSTKISITWNENSQISALLHGGNFHNLKIAGWDGSQWVIIASEIDATSILGNESSLTSGSITSSASIVPDTYEIYTFAVKKQDALPVVLTSFHVKSEYSTSVIDWVTVSEAHSDRFEVQHSRDGKKWEMIGTIEAKSHGAELNLSRNDYQFIHKNPVSGNNLYRLKMIDLDESFSFSQIRNLRYDADVVAYAYPNPTSDRVFINSQHQSSYENISIYNTGGSQVMKFKSFSDDGISLSQFESGIYLIKIQFTDGESSTTKIVLKK